MIELGRLLDILDENKIKYPKKFTTIELDGYDSNRCELFSKKLREDIEELLKIGVNGGFDVNIKTAIYELADMASAMTKDRAALKLDEYEIKAQQIVKKIKNKGDDDMADIRGEIIRYIDNSIVGVDMLVDGDMSEYDKSILMAARDRLFEIRDTLDEVIDNSSQDAARRAKYVYGDSAYALCAWRDSVARGMFYDGMNKHLDEALEEAIRWTDLTKEVSKRKVAKDSDILEYKDDMFARMIKKDEVKEKGDAFFAKLKSFNKQFEIQNETYDNISQINSEIEAIHASIAALIDKMDNGEILEEEALLQIDMLEEDAELKKAERDTYRTSLKMIAGTISGMKRLLQRFKKLELMFNLFQKIEPNMFYAMFSYIDFNRFLDVLSYGASEEEINTALSYYEIVMENVQEQTSHLAGVDNRFDEVNKTLEKFKNPSKKKASQEDEEREAKARKDKLDELRKKYKKPDPHAGEKEKTEEKKASSDELGDLIEKITKKK